MIKKDNQLNLGEDLVSQIKSYYEKALLAIQNKDQRSATKILHNQMPLQLYDLSLDIMDNRNLEFAHKDLKELIIMVYNLLESDDEDSDPQPDILDTFQGDIF